MRIWTLNGAGNTRRSSATFCRRHGGRNFALIDRYPDYLFNFTGANRYAYIEETFQQRLARAEALCGRGPLVSRRLEHGGVGPRCALGRIDTAADSLRHGFCCREPGVAGEDFMTRAFAIRPRSRAYWHTRA